MSNALTTTSQTPLPAPALPQLPSVPPPPRVWPDALIDGLMILALSAFAVVKLVPIEYVLPALFYIAGWRAQKAAGASSGAGSSASAAATGAVLGTLGALASWIAPHAPLILSRGAALKVGA